MSKGLFITAATAIALSVSLAGNATAQSFPDKPIRVIVPFAAGGQGDVNARLVVNRIEELGLLSQPMVVINAPGGGATIGIRQAKEAEPDGYTLLFIHQTMMTAEIRGTLDFNYTEMVPIAETSNSCLLTATATGSGLESAQDWIDQVHAAPGKIKEATLIGSAAHFTTAMFANAADMDVGYVHVGGGADRIASILGNHTSTAVLVARPVVSNPNISALVYYGEERHPDLPDTPTAIELGYDVVSCLDNVWWAPEGTPDEVVTQLADVFEQVIADPDMVSSIEGRGESVVFARGEELDTRLANIYESLAAVGDAVQ